MHKLSTIEKNQREVIFFIAKFSNPHHTKTTKKFKSCFTFLLSRLLLVGGRCPCFASSSSSMSWADWFGIGGGGADGRGGDGRWGTTGLAGWDTSLDAPFECAAVADAPAPF